MFFILEEVESDDGDLVRLFAKSPFTMLYFLDIEVYFEVIIKYF